MATKEQVRGAILAKRIKTINNFLLEKIGTNTTFGDYLKSLGIDEATFLKDLPEWLAIGGISKSTPDSENMIKYGQLLNLHLHHQKLFHIGKTNEILSADAINDLSQAVVPVNYLDYSADGIIKVKKPVPVSKPTYSGGTDSKGQLYHSATAHNAPKKKKRYDLDAAGESIMLVKSSDNVSGLTPYVGRDSSYVADGYYNGSGKVKKFFHKVGQQIDQASQQVKGAIKDTGNAIQKAGKDLGHAVTHPKELLHGLNALNPVTVLMRGAFLSLLSINAAALASALRAIKNDKDQSHWNKIVAKWNILGGDTSKLKSTIDNGSNHKPFPKIKKNGSHADGDSEELDVNDAKNASKTALGSAGALGGLAALLASNPATAGAAVWVGSAAGVLATVQPILKNFAKAKGEDASLVADLPNDPKLDADTTNALKDIEDGKNIDVPNFWDEYKGWIIGMVALIGGISLALIVVGKKK